MKDGRYWTLSGMEFTRKGGEWFAAWRVGKPSICNDDAAMVRMFGELFGA